LTLRVSGLRPRLRTVPCSLSYGSRPILEPTTNPNAIPARSHMRFITRFLSPRATLFSSPLASSCFPPVPLRHVNVKLLRSGKDALPRSIAFGITHSLNLIEASNGVSHVSRIVQWLLAFFRESEL
jgi:hypothetical protein